MILRVPVIQSPAARKPRASGDDPVRHQLLILDVG